jgi:hypothetical protein
MLNFNVKGGKEGIFKPTIGNESHALPHLKILQSEEQYFHIVTFINLFRLILTEKTPQSD